MNQIITNFKKRNSNHNMEQIDKYNNVITPTGKKNETKYNKDNILNLI